MVDERDGIKFCTYCGKALRMHEYLCEGCGTTMEQESTPVKEIVSPLNKRPVYMVRPKNKKLSKISITYIFLIVFFSIIFSLFLLDYSEIGLNFFSFMINSGDSIGSRFWIGFGLIIYIIIGVFGAIIITCIIVYAYKKLNKNVIKVMN